MSLDHYAHASLTPPHQPIVIRPLIFPSRPSSLGITSTRATLTSQGSCSSHPDLPLISIDFFILLLLRLIRILRRIWELSPGSNVSLSQSGRLYNYSGRQHAIQFFIRFSSAEVIPPSFSLPCSLPCQFLFFSMLSDWKHFPKSKLLPHHPPPASCSYD